LILHHLENLVVEAAFLGPQLIQLILAKGPKTGTENLQPDLELVAANYPHIHLQVEGPHKIQLVGPHLHRSPEWLVEVEVEVALCYSNPVRGLCHQIEVVLGFQTGEGHQKRVVMVQKRKEAVAVVGLN
jgi:hypothetical protein